jgi:hypothetical protein
MIFSLQNKATKKIANSEHGNAPRLLSLRSKPLIETVEKLRGKKPKKMGRETSHQNLLKRPHPKMVTSTASVRHHPECKKNYPTLGKPFRRETSSAKPKTLNNLGKDQTLNFSVLYESYTSL